MIDIHCHIIPEVDDGAKSMEEALKMGRLAAEEGFKKILATPHHIEGSFCASKESLLEKVEKINQIFRTEGIDLEILPGTEAYLSLDLPDKVKRGEVLSLNQGSFLLLELPMGDVPHYTEDTLYQLRLLGYKPIIAHPERYRAVAENPNLVKGWIEQGNYIQVNTMSITGAMGKNAQQTAEILAKHDMIHLLGTDAHSSGRRSPRIQEALRVMEHWVGGKKLQHILTNGEGVVEGKDLAIYDPIPYRKKNKFFSLTEKFFRPSKKQAYE